MAFCFFKQEKFDVSQADTLDVCLLSGDFLELCPFQLNSCVSENFFYCLAGGRSVKQSGKKPAGTIKT